MGEVEDTLVPWWAGGGRGMRREKSSRGSLI